MLFNKMIQYTNFDEIILLKVQNNDPHNYMHQFIYLIEFIYLYLLGKNAETW